VSTRNETCDPAALLRTLGRIVKRIVLGAIIVSVPFAFLACDEAIVKKSVIDIVKAMGDGVANVTTKKELNLLNTFPMKATPTCKDCKTDPSSKTSTKSYLSIVPSATVINKSKFDGSIYVYFSVRHWQCTALPPNGSCGSAGGSPVSCCSGYKLSKGKLDEYKLFAGIYIKNKDFKLTTEWSTAPPTNVQAFYETLLKNWLKDSVAAMNKQTKYGFDAVQVHYGYDSAGEPQVGLIGKKKPGP
jgi:hypothetical protein